LEINFVSNNFIENSAVNGGALYISNSNKIDTNDNKPINFEINEFQKNRADYFGGAIYSEYEKLNLATIKECVIENNYSGIMGGGIYSPKSVNQTLFNIYNTTNSNIKILNNKASSSVDNFSSKPSYITLETKLNSTKITMGDNLSLTFYLYDEFNNLVEDTIKYYSIGLKAELKNNNYIDDDESISLLGNIGTFAYGKYFYFHLK